jgi:hypothetical protein
MPWEARTSYCKSARTAANASAALVDVLRVIVAKDPSKIAELSNRVTTRTRRHVARSPAEIYPSRPDFARAEEISPGWLVGLNIDNRDKQMIIREACDIYGVAIQGDLNLVLPNT